MAFVDYCKCHWMKESHKLLSNGAYPLVTTTGSLWRGRKNSLLLRNSQVCTCSKLTLWVGHLLVMNVLEAPLDVILKKIGSYIISIITIHISSSCSKGGSGIIVNKQHHSLAAGVHSMESVSWTEGSMTLANRKLRSWKYWFEFQIIPLADDLEKIILFPRACISSCRRIVGQFTLQIGMKSL